VGLESGTLSLVSTTEELLERKSSGSGLENRDYGRRGSTALTTGHLSIRKNVGIKSADKRLSLGRYSSLVDSGLKVCFVVYRACSTHGGRIGMHRGFWWEHREERHH
jgi:hypothetical protein